MGNCLQSNSKVDNASDPSKVTNRTSISSFTSSLMTRPYSSNLFVSISERSGYESLPTPRTEGEILSSSNLKAFTFNELRIATRNFRPDCLLGEGAFGRVYKGWIDGYTFVPSKPGTGIAIAVKKLTAESFQGHKEWLTEVNYLGQLHHPNLVKLIGYCSKGDDRLLVYEFILKGSLDNHLFRRDAQPLSWDIRIKVAIGAAKGISYMHDAETQVIYRDFKTSNILLDSEFNCKLSDFGLARAGPTGDNTHVSTRIIGTLGYIDPEYLATGHLSARSDVYAFGVVLFELLSGCRAWDMLKSEFGVHLVDWARHNLVDKRKLFQIMDSQLADQYPKEGAHAVATLALQCMSIEPELRPRMPEVLVALEQLK